MNIYGTPVDYEPAYDANGNEVGGVYSFNDFSITTISLPEAKLSKLLIIIDHNKPHMTNHPVREFLPGYFFMYFFLYFSGRSFRCFLDSSYFFSSFNAFSPCGYRIMILNIVIRPIPTSPRSHTKV